MNGCTDVLINTTALGLGSPLLPPQNNLKFDFEFMDAATKFVQERTLVVPIAARPVSISFPSTKLVKTYFKHNLPYFGELLVERPDGSPAVEHKVKVCYEKRVMPWVSKEDFICSELKVNNEGRVAFIIPPQDVDAKQIFIR